MKVLKRLAGAMLIALIAIVLSACDSLPAGDYVVQPGKPEVTPVATWQGYGYTVYLVKPAPTPTPEGGIPTSPPTTVTKCQLQILNYNHNLRTQPNTGASIIGNIERMNWVDGLEFYYTMKNEEWAKVTATLTTGKVATGWIMVDENVTYDRTGPCMDVPSTFEKPLPTIAPTATPVPGPTPTVVPTYPPPLPQECVLYNPNTYGMNMRASYSTAAAIVGSFPAGAKGYVGLLYPSATNAQWAYITYQGKAGWVAVKLSGTTYTLLQGDCSKIPAPKVEARLEGGLHILQVANGGLISQYAGAFQTFKCLNGTEAICLALKRQNPSVTIVFRSLHVQDGMRDCPNVAEWYSPSIWWNKLRPYLPDGFDYYEVINECGAPYDDYAQMAKFHIEVAKMANREGKAILAFSFPAGNPPLPAWSALLEYLKWADANPLPNGRRNGVAWHTAFYAPAGIPLRPNSWINNAWVAGRDLLIRDYLKANHNYDLAGFRGPIYVTEIGVRDGYSGDWNDTWTCGQLQQMWAATKAEYLARHPWITGWHYWNIGGSGTRWSNDEPCLAQLAAGNQ